MINNTALELARLRFNDKETYIAWRAEWRAAYKQLSKDIRDLKFAVAYEARICAKCDVPQAHVEAYGAIKQRLGSGNGTPFYPLYIRDKYRAVAADMMIARQMSKEKAQANYAVEKARASKDVPVAA